MVGLPMAIGAAEKSIAREWAIASLCGSDGRTAPTLAQHAQLIALGSGVCAVSRQWLAELFALASIALVLTVLASIALWQCSRFA
ncbi:hypothetical protein AGMMS50229_12640 [Campylobacterota bacterium]|nr:hypothetical protein AGMMS50229_12640 [Campylobacterota bacterium]